VLFRLKDEDPAGASQAARTGIDQGYGIGRCTLYAAHFAVGQRGRMLMVKYHEEGMKNDFSQLMRISGNPDSDGETWFFFPTYDSVSFNRFEGIAVPREDAGNFLGLYRVGERNLPPLLPCATLYGSGSAERLCAAIKVPYSPVDLQISEQGPHWWWEESELAEKAGDVSKALTLLRAYDAAAPSRQALEKEASLFCRAGKTAQELDTLKLLVTNHGDYDACERLDGFLAERMTVEERLRVWASLASLPEASGQVRLHYVAACIVWLHDETFNLNGH
jgi:hypothetical protein